MAPRAASRRSSSSVELHAVDGEQALGSAGRAARGTPPARSRAAPSRAFHAPIRSSRSRHGPVPSRRNSTSSADSPRCTLSGAAAGRSADRAKEIGRDRVRRMRHDRRPQPLDRRQPRPDAARAASTSAIRVGGAEPEELVRTRPPTVRSPASGSQASSVFSRRRRATSRSRAPRRSPRRPPPGGCSALDGCASVSVRRSAAPPRPASRRQAARVRASTTARDACGR